MRAYMHAFVHHNVMHCIHACVCTSQCHALHTCMRLYITMSCIHMSDIPWEKRGCRDKQLLGPDIKCMPSEITAHLYMLSIDILLRIMIIHVAMILQLLTYEINSTCSFISTILIPFYHRMHSCMCIVCMTL